MSAESEMRRIKTLPGIGRVTVEILDLRPAARFVARAYPTRAAAHDFVIARLKDRPLTQGVGLNELTEEIEKVTDTATRHAFGATILEALQKLRQALLH